ncbi:hypothetical protein Tco_1545162, partial [Tanacetum coccineum]
MLKIPSSAKLKLRLVNVEADHAQVNNGSADVTKINFKKVGGDKKWEDFFPEWVDENGKWGPMKCPEIHRHMRRWTLWWLSGWENGDEREMYVVFIGKSGPMWEIFMCDDIIWEE